MSEDIVKLNQIGYIQFQIRVNKAPELTKRPVFKGALLRLKGQASSICVAPIITFSLILAWPGLTIKKRLYASIMAVPLIVLLAALDYPIIFIEEIESVFSNAPIQNTILKLWKHLMNNGGRQFLALIISLFMIMITSRSPKPCIDRKTVGRNDPCPCGSGKKYKYCCLRKE